MREAKDITVYNMMATPFHDDGSLDLDSFTRLLDHMCDANIGVYLGSGGAGEGHALTLAELRDLYRVGVEVCKGRVPVAANPREPRTAAQMLELIQVAVAEGVELVQVYSLDPGHGMKPTPVELERYYRFVLGHIECPTALSVHANYQYPVPTTLLAELCADYAHIEAINVIMPMAYYLETQAAVAGVGREIRLYTSVHTLVEGLFAGSSGCQAAEPNLIPFTMRRFAEALAGGDTDVASRLYLFVYRFSSVVQRWAPSTARWVKMGLHVLGLPGSNGMLREPYVLPDAEQLGDMRTAFDRLGVAAMEAESAAALTASSTRA